MVNTYTSHFEFCTSWENKHSPVHNQPNQKQAIITKTHQLTHPAPTAQQLAGRYKHIGLNSLCYHE